MKLRHFLNTIEHDRIHQAIQSAEKDTSGRIMIYVSHRRMTDAMEEAHRLFIRHKLETEEEKTGLLIFLAPKTQKFAVIGGTALHEKLGQPWWDHLAATISRHFKEDRYTDGLLEAIEEMGRALKANFPDMRGPRPDRPDIIEK